MRSVRPRGRSRRACRCRRPHRDGARRSACRARQQVGGNLSAALAQQYATIGATTQLAGGDVTTQATNLAAERVREDGRLLHRVSGRHPALSACRSTRRCRRPASRCRARSRIARTSRCSTTTSSCCSRRSARSRTASPALRGTPLPATCLAGAGATLYRCNQLGAFGLNQDDAAGATSSTSARAVHRDQTFANVLGASQMVLCSRGRGLHPRASKTSSAAARTAAACATTGRAPR